MKQIKTLSEKVPSVELNLSNLKTRLIPIDGSVVDIEIKIKTTNENLTNFETRINLISDTSSKLGRDLPIQQQRLTDMENKLTNMDIIISNISNNITSIDDHSNDVKENLRMAEKNQTSLKGLLNETVERAENVHKNLSKIQNMFSEVLKHLPTIEKFNKSLTLILKIDNHLPTLHRHLHENEDRLHDLERELNITQSKFKHFKKTSESTIKIVSLAMEKQTDIETKIQMSYEELTELQQDLLNTDENIKNRLTKLPEDFKASASILLDRTSTLDRKISTTEGRTEVMVIRLDEYSEKLENFRSNVDTLSNYVDNIKPIIDYQ